MSKSHHHRAENTFRFQTFHERLANINIDVARRLGKFSSNPEDADTFFGEALAKWSDLNCTKQFVEFRREITKDVQSFHQLVHHQDEIVGALTRHLQVPNSLALQPLLDLVVQLARDLQSDFYPCFPEFFQVIIGLLNTYHHDVELLEQAFTCLAYIFKFLWRLMLKDMTTVYKLFSPLLSNKYKTYINNFASESFSFLMRKAKDYDELFEFMFTSLQDTPDQTSGVGRLLFEMVRGVRKQLHSSTDQVLSVLLTKLEVSKLPQELVLDTLQEMFEAIAAYIDPQQTQCVWSPLLTCIENAHADCCAAPTRRKKSHFDSYLCSLLKLCHILVEYKSGLLLGNAAELTQRLKILLESDSLSDTCGDVLLGNVTTLLMGLKCSLSAQDRTKLILLVYNTAYPDHLIFDFTRRLFDLPLFEKDVLPALLGYCHRATIDGEPEVYDRVLFLMTELLTTKHPVSTGPAEPSSLNIYPLDFPTTRKKEIGFVEWVTDRLTRWLTDLNKAEKLTNLASLWALVTCLPHMRLSKADKSVPTLGTLVKKLQSVVSPDLSRTIQDSVLCVLYQAVMALYLMQEVSAFFKSLPFKSLTQLVSAFPDNVHCLRLVDFYTTASKQAEHTELLDDENFTDLFEHLESNLQSPHSQIRMLTLHICCQFDLDLPPLDPESGIEQIGVFEICLQSELCELSVHTYRDKLVYLRKLDYNLIQNQLPCGDFWRVPLKYLLGMLYCNFTLIWEPVMELIKSHAHALSTTQFWEVFGSSLQEVAKATELEFQKSDDRPELENDDVNQEVDTTALEYVFHTLLEKLSNDNRSVAHVNYRHLLWKTMLQFPEKCEPRSRFLSPLLFQFLNKEYYPEDLAAAPTQNIKRVESGDHSPGDTSNMDQSELGENSILDDSQVEETERRKKPDNKRPKRAGTKTLVVHLTLFANFRSPKNLYLEPKLRDLYFELLQHRHPDVQKVAFECIMTYGYKYLTPYRENFERLLDDKHFKDEIVLFGIDEESTIIQNEHREQLLPVLLSILYGKMRSKSANESSGRGHGQGRKNLVLRFLAGCNQDELKVFLDLVFQPLKHFVADDILQKVEEVTDVDLGAIIPLRKQLSLLSTVDIVLKKLGSLVGKYLPDMLRMLVCISAHSNAMLQQRDVINPNSITLLRTIRSTAQVRIVQFFESFVKYPYRQDEIEAVFSAVIWPQVDKLANEGIYSPTPLLKLFRAWSENSRYIPLLSKCSEKVPDVTCLRPVFQLLLVKLTRPPVISIIMEIVENLLTIEDYQPTDEVAAIEPGPTVTLDTDNDLTCGTRLLLPHVPSVLQHLKGAVQKMSESNKKRKTIPTRELTILSRLSEYVDDPEQSGQVVSLLLPLLGRPLHRTVDVEVHILTAVKNLIKQVSSPESFLEVVARLFSVMSANASRTVLCGVVQAISVRVTSVSKLADLITKINAFDPKRIEEPDYMVRLEGFEEAGEEMTRRGLLDTTLLLMLLHNCTYFMAHMDDMSLRDVSAHCLRNMLRMISEKTDHKSPVYNLVVQRHLLPELKTNLKVKNEVARHEFINILSHLVDQFPNSPSFCDLVVLTDKVDVEVDFFSNITHIQLHRRVRALRRFGRILSTNGMNTDTLVCYLLPIVTSFLRDSTYSKANNVLEAAVDALGTICRHLPWPRYLILLQYYLTLLPKSLDKQKLIVRTVVSILDSFHFDLSNSQGVSGAQIGTVTTVGDDPSNSTENKKKEDANKESTEHEKNSAEDARKEVIDKAQDGSVEKDVTDDSLKEINQKDEAKETEEDEVSEDTIYEGESHADSEESVTKAKPGGKTICGVGLATRIHRMIVRKILPQLYKCLTQKAKSDDQHKKAQASKYAEDEEILRVPIALAMVKLMEALPKGALKQNLPSVLLKVCHFLKSRARDIREAARGTLVKIMKTLGPSYLPYILMELKSALQRGYQLHVLSYTVWALLSNMEDTLKHGEIDNSITLLVQVLNEELFGKVADEKEVEGIVGKLFEARSSKSFVSYFIMAKFVSKTSLGRIITPLKELLETTHSHKRASKVAGVLSKIAQGLVENKELDLETELTFIYALTTNSLPSKKSAKEKKEQKEATPGQRPPSTYLLKAAPPRGGSKPKPHANTNMYVVVDFGLNLLHLLLKRSTLHANDVTHLRLLDPFVAIFNSCLTSKHVKVTTTALRCLLWILKFPLPSLKTSIKAIANRLFMLLNNYASAGAARGDNFELVVMCFKVMAVLVRDVSYYTISTDQLQVLLTYAEQDIHDFTRQATAFALFKAILSRKLMVSEIHDVIKRLEILSITSESPHIRLQCRQVLMQFILDYPLGNALRQHLEYYVKQLEYEQESGRQSALEMLASMFSYFPEKVLKEYNGFFFVPLASRLVNDESAKCRKLSALAVKALIQKLDSGKRDFLFNMCLQWLQDSKILVRKLAAVAIGLFVEVESAAFERHLAILLPIIAHQIHPDKYAEEAEEAKLERQQDHYLFSVLNLLVKILRECNIFSEPKWNSTLNPIWGSVQSHLLYPHTWVKLITCQLFGLLFAATSPEQITLASQKVQITPQKTSEKPPYKKTKKKKAKLKEEPNEEIEEESEYLCTEVHEKIYHLCGSFCKQLTSPLLDSDLSEQVMKNLVFLAKVLNRIGLTESDSSNDVTSQNDDVSNIGHRTSLRWLIKKLCKEARVEAATNPKVNLKRSSVFKFLAAVSLDLGNEHLPGYLPLILPPIIREFTSKAATVDEELKKLSQEVLDLIKGCVGVETFSREYAQALKALLDKRQTQKRERAVEAVANPEIAAKRRIKKTQLKKESRKRKIQEMRPAKKSKRSRLHDMAVVS